MAPKMAFGSFIACHTQGEEQMQFKNQNQVIPLITTSR